MEERRLGTNPTIETRAESNETVDKAKRYQQIIEILVGGKEMTAKEIAVEMWNRGYIPTSERNFTAPRLTELSYKGIVEPCGKQKCSYTGKTVAVYRLIEGQTNINMFTNLKELNINHWNTDNVTRLDGCFKNCKSLKNYDFYKEG